jgi:hypothetical protein
VLSTIAGYSTLSMHLPKLESTSVHLTVTPCKRSLWVVHQSVLQFTVINTILSYDLTLKYIFLILILLPNFQPLIEISIELRH